VSQRQVICPYCQKQAELVGGAVIYPHRQDLHWMRLWACLPCGAWVGCHHGKRVPLGRLANAELRRWKQNAHAVFDPLWKSRTMSRKDAYRWLSETLGIPFKETHIGMFDVETCKRVVEACRAKRATA
jgi:hypothetical protein